jgi:virulence factor Mce-like protein
VSGRLLALGVRRLLALAVVSVLAAAGVALALGTASSGAADDASYRVNAIFDTAKGIIPGQVVKIAGARVGTVDDVTLTEDYQARIEMSVDRRFAPFKSDAACDIQPEGLISERFVQCDPGSPDGRELQEEDDVPAVPVTRTKVPVAFTDLFNVFDLPVRQRFSIVVSSLGLGLAGRGTDVNDVLRRANPTLGLLREVLDRLDRDKRDLQDAVSATDRVVADLAKRPERVGDFVDRAAAVATRTANRRSELQEGVRRLPALLDETEPTLRRFETFAREATPLLRDVRTAAPDIAALLRQIAPAAAAGRPALRALGDTAVTGRRTIRSARPVVKLLRSFATAALPTGVQLADLLTNLRDRVVTESLGRYAHNAVGFTGRYDSYGHIAPAHAFFNKCALFHETPDPDCRATYTTPTPQQAAKKAPTRAPSGASDAPAPTAAPAPAGTGDATPATPSRPALPAIELPGLPPIKVPGLDRLPELVPGLLGGGTSGKDAGAGDTRTTESLLDYLLG